MERFRWAVNSLLRNWWETPGCLSGSIGPDESKGGMIEGEAAQMKSCDHTGQSYENAHELSGGNLKHTTEDATQTEYEWQKTEDVNQTGR